MNSVYTSIHPDDIPVLETIAQQEDRVPRQKAIVLLEIHKGSTPKVAAATAATLLTNVYNILKGYQNQGLQFVKNGKQLRQNDRFDRG